MQGRSKLGFVLSHLMLFSLDSMTSNIVSRPMKTDKVSVVTNMSLADDGDVIVFYDQ